MNYLENRSIFYNSDYAMEIVDKWITGIPFFMKIEGAIYDAFLFYSDNRKKTQYYSVKMLVLTSASTGEIKDITNELDAYNLSNDFSFEIKIFSDIDEYLVLNEALQEAYVKLRDNYISCGSLDRTLQDQYLNIAMRLIPSEILNNVYSPLAPELFIER